MLTGIKTQHCVIIHLLYKPGILLDVKFGKGFVFLLISCYILYPYYPLSVVMLFHTLFNSS